MSENIPSFTWDNLFRASCASGTCQHLQNSPKQISVNIWDWSGKLKPLQRVC